MRINPLGCQPIRPDKKQPKPISFKDEAKKPEPPKEEVKSAANPGFKAKQPEPEIKEKPIKEKVIFIKKPQTGKKLDCMV